MAKRKSGLEIFDSLADSAIESMFDRGAEWIERLKKDGGAKPIVGVDYTCIACKQPKPCELVNPVADPSAPGYGFGICKSCLDFAWTAMKEKMAFLARNAARTAAARAAAPPVPPKRPPWEVLEISADATEDEIKKAYRRIAALWHPDRFQTADERDRARVVFEEVSRARDAMLKVRKVES